MTYEKGGSSGALDADDSLQKDFRKPEADVNAFGAQGQKSLSVLLKSLSGEKEAS